MSYTKTIWVDGVTPLSAANMNNIETMLKSLEYIPKDIEDLKINALLTDLQLTANSSNIDAWCDLIGDASLINAGASSLYRLDSGSLKRGYNIQIGYGNGGNTFGLRYSTAQTKLGQTFVPNQNVLSMSITAKLSESGTISSGNISCKIYDSTGTTLIATALNTVSAGGLTTGLYTFNFTGLSLVSGTTYMCVFESTYAISTSNYIQIYGTDSGGYASGSGYYYNGTSWASQTLDFGLNIIFNGVGYAVWNAVTSSEILTKMAVVANQANGTYGFIAWYVSDDGTNWVYITNIKQMYDTGFDATSVYLKCEITMDAHVEAVAWGG